jgi:hypothetical protein
MKCRLSVLFLFICIRSFPQAQTCPVNINFASGDLSHWYAYTGNNVNGNVDATDSSAIKARYDSTSTAPSGTIGVKSIQEYNLGSVTGIKVITFRGTDPFGGFSTIPTINGYSYNYSIQLGSTAITRGNGNNRQSGGGYIRGVSYRILVPPGPSTEPYTMTYAYAMVLENGTHVSSQQPLIRATLKTPAGVIDCASPSYYLPTFNNVSEGGLGATLDSAAAKKNGFSVSSLRSPNASLNSGPGGTEFLEDVWTKGWTEVTFDLSPYRGQQVSFTFEADNCMPGGHFAYGYIAIRNSCAGLMISGDSLICYNTAVTYSVPALAGATYNWIVPNDWSLLSGDTSNIIRVKTATAGGTISVREKNSCADLSDTIQIKTLPSPVGGVLDGSSEVCAGQNITTLNLNNYSGTISNWLSSTDSITWIVVPDITARFTAENLDATTLYKVVVGKGTVCPPDTSSGALVVVDQKTIGGIVNPPDAILCDGQTAGELLVLSGTNGSVQNWQSSTDGTTWADLNPLDPTLTNRVTGITVSTQYRVVDKDGVCPPDTSSVASITFDPVPFPKAFTDPADTTICFGTSAILDVNIVTGTSFIWSPSLTDNGTVSSVPYFFTNEVSPKTTTDYVLHVLNTGCPNPLLDTFHVVVLDPVIVNAGRDTSVVVGEPMQFNAYSSDAGPDSFLWFPGTELNDPTIADPLATYTVNDTVIRYSVKATTPFGCTGEGFITVKVFKTKPDIFVPNAFTPGQAVNAIFRPIPVGISSLQYFRIYNRTGQLVYSTSSIGNGWDGMLDGIPQSVGGYVWMVKGTDFNGNLITKKGTMVLIR